MLIDAFYGALYILLTGILTFIPDIKITIPSGVIQSALEFLRFGGYLLPMGTIAMIFSLILLLLSFRIGVAIFKFIYGMFGR